MRPESLKILKSKIDKLMPRIDFPELLLEVDRISNFTDECSHISDNNSRISGIEVSLCADFYGRSMQYWHRTIG